ncbi:MAG TPA: S41 family peptidase [Puia sp.]|nr:S41 family peptidase [Puia sp.]
MKFPFVTLVAVTLVLFCQPASAQLTPQQQKNLAAFTRLYGYVRYFHPSDEAAELDWDNFAIYGAKRVIVANDDQELISALQELFHPFAPTVVIYPATAKDTFSLATITPPHKDGYMPIAWQHYGVELAPQGLYKSIRVNRPVAERPVSQSFAPIVQTFPADKIKGKDFRLSGWMKVDSTSGGAGYLMMRLQKKGKVVFFYSMGDHPATSGSWKEYSITGTANKDADTAMIGAMLGGKGALWIDGLRLAVKDGDDWKNISLNNGGFEDKETYPWSYNPSLPGFRFATVSKDVYEGEKAMYITSFNDRTRRSKTVARPLFDHYPNPGEYIQRPLASGIDCIVPIALYGTKEQTFPQGDSAALSRLDNAIHGAVSGGNNGDKLLVRLGDIVISWNILRHFFSYWEDASATPDELLDKALTNAVKDKNRYDFITTLQWMTAPLNDGHIYVYMDGDTTGRVYAPLVFAKAEDRVVIDRVLDSTLALSPGDVVTTINNTPADRYMAYLDSKESGSPQLKVFRDLASLTIGPRDSLTLGVRRADGLHTVHVPRTLDWQAWEKGHLKPPSGWIKPHVFYIDLDRDPMDSIRVWMPQLEQARAIICDLRGYPKGNHELIAHFLTEPENTKWMFVPQVTYPDFQKVTYNELGWNMRPINPHLNGKIFFLIDGSAISYADSYMGYIKDFHLATIVGQPTAGTNGDINRLYLPGGYHIHFSGMLVKDHHGGKHHLIGAVPDVPVERTIKGIREGRDEILDKALELATKGR